MAIDIEETTLWDAVGHVGSTMSAVHQHDIMRHFSVWTNIVDGAPSVASFTTADITTTGNYIRKTSHGYVTGLNGLLTGTGAALPTGLATATTYFIVNLSADTFGLATSKANAIAGTLVTLAKDNTISAFHPAAFGTLGVTFKASFDGTNYWNVPGVTITAVGATCTSVADIAYNYLKLDLTLTSGQATATAKVRSLGG
jgi:hypothetical protein